MSLPFTRTELIEGRVVMFFALHGDPRFQIFSSDTAAEAKMQLLRREGVTAVRLIYQTDDPILLS